MVPRPSGQGPSSASGTESGRFCVCGAADDNDEETFIKCSIGTGGCNGWVHLRCSELPAAEMDAIILDKKMPARYICRLCRGAGRGRRGTVPTAAAPAGGTTQEMDVSIGHLYFTLTALLIFLPCVSVPGYFLGTDEETREATTGKGRVVAGKSDEEAQAVSIMHAQVSVPPPVKGDLCRHSRVTSCFG